MSRIDHSTAETFSLRARSAQHAASILVSIGLVCGLASCVSQQKRRYEEARELYEDCLAENPRAPEACEDLRQAAITAGDAYEQDAQRAWGCRNTPDRCDPVSNSRPPAD